MSSRQGRQAAARSARVAHEAQARAAAARRWRLHALGGALAAAVAVAGVAVAISSGGGGAAAASRAKLMGATFSSRLFAGIPQHGTVLGRPDAPARIVEFADLQCPYCREYTIQALPSLVNDYVRTGKVQMEFETLSFIGPGSVQAGRAAAAAARQNKLWNFVDLMYLNQGAENTGYVTPTYLRQLLRAIPGLNIAAALSASQERAADSALTQANNLAVKDGITGTPSFLIGRANGPLLPFQPAILTAAPFAAALTSLLAGSR
jgi:protein-disulfide isomerase